MRTRIVQIAGLLFLIGLVLAVRAPEMRQVVHEWGVIYVDPDCFSRMERVKMLEEGEGPVLKFHAFENHPEGTTPHTTVPLDYAILSLRWLLTPFSENPRDLAGVWISPLLGVFGAIALWWGTLGCRYRWQLLLLYALSPALAHATAFGRPDHQSMILMFLAMAWVAEWRFWQQPGRAFAILAGAAWGLALWTSLFEPLVMGVVTLLAVAVARPPIFFRRERIWEGAVAGGILLVALAVEGVRLTPPGTGEGGQYFASWAMTIGELQRGDLRLMHASVGWLFLAAPVLALWSWWREPRREVLVWLAVMLVLAALTFWQIRWNGVMPLWFALGLPLLWAPLRKWWSVLPWAAFIVALWPMMAEWENLWLPDGPRQVLLEERVEDARILHGASQFLNEQPRGGVLAPWWLSHQIAYWSGQPTVAGSSHQSLPGIVDTARFWVEDDPDQAREMLRQREVRYVVTTDVDRAISTAEPLLDAEAPERNMARRLGDFRPEPPEFLELIHEEEHLRVWRVRNGSFIGD